ncbi:FYVE zinc finger-domain-containing protein [Suillus spraguei]|nr:FYVE zinc finger-domain-containing protein [Suillus spraguei]
MSVLQVATVLANLAAKAHSTMAFTGSSISNELECSSDASSLAEGSFTTSDSSLYPASPRTNEHLAVLLPRSLWKPDSLASTCDNFYCHIKFSVLERRHHCRKCGGVFCHQCTTRSTHLLDVSNLDFLHPPRNVPISNYDSPTSPVLVKKVCDDCWDQIHGCNSPRTPDGRPSTPMLVKSPVDSRTPSPDSSVCASPVDSPVSPSRPIRVARSSSHFNTGLLALPTSIFVLLNSRFLNHHTANWTHIHYGGPVSFVRQQAAVAGNPNTHLPRSVSGYLGARHHTKLKWNEKSKKSSVAVRIQLCEMESFNIDSGRTGLWPVFPAMLCVSLPSRLSVLSIVYIA